MTTTAAWGSLAREVIRTRSNSRVPRGLQGANLPSATCARHSGCRAGVLQKTDDEAHHQLAFRRFALCNQQCKGDERVVVESQRAIGAQQTAVLVEVVQEQQASDPLVAVRERVVLDQEVEQVGGADLHARIKQLPSEALLDGAKYAGEGIAAFVSEQVRSFPLCAQVTLESANSLAGLRQRQPHHFAGRLCRLLGKAPFIVPKEQTPRARVALNDAEDCPGFLVAELWSVQHISGEA